MQDFRGRVAVVTGAASGIGLGVTERFLREGMKVVMADVEKANLERESARLRRAGARRAARDLRRARSRRGPGSREADASSHYGAVHVVFNNAGVGPAGPMLETTPADWRWIVDVNVLGVAYGVIAFGPILKKQGEGHIINTASEAGHVSSAMLGMYTATKHAVVGLSESLYRELEGTGVGVSTASARTSCARRSSTPSATATTAPR